MYTTFHKFCYRKQRQIVCEKGITEFQTLCVGFKVVENIKLSDIVRCWLNKLGFYRMDLCLNLVLVWACNIQGGLLLQHTALTISFVHGSNPMDQMLFCCVAVFQYFSMICQRGASVNGLQHVASYYLPSPIGLHSYTAICSRFRAAGDCPSEIHDVPFLSDQSDGCGDCWRLWIEV